MSVRPFNQVRRLHSIKIGNGNGNIELKLKLSKIAIKIDLVVNQYHFGRKMSPDRNLANISLVF